MSNKKLDSLSLEDLYKALESPEDSDIPLPLPEDTPPVIEFIKRFKLASGKHRVETNLLWNLYLQYYPCTMSKHVFCEHANKLLRYKRDSFRLNKTSEYLHSLLITKQKPVKKHTKAAEGLNRHFAAFFKNLNVEKGKHRIPWYVFFHMYRCYCIDHKIKRPRSKAVFLKFVSKYFDKITSDFGSIFLVDKQTAHAIPKEDYERLKRLYKEENTQRWLQVSCSPKFAKSKK